MERKQLKHFLADKQALTDMYCIIYIYTKKHRSCVHISFYIDTFSHLYIYIYIYIHTYLQLTCVVTIAMSGTP